MNNIFKIVTLRDNNIEKIDEYNNNNNKNKIFLDDTIDILKKKIMIANSNLCFENIYLFCQINYLIDIKFIYNALTNNDKIQLNKLMLMYFLKNINNEKLIEKLEDKSVYFLNDLEQLDLDKKEVIMNIPIGQKYLNDYKFIVSNVVNPYEVEEFDIFYEKKLIDELVTTNRELLFFSILKNRDIIDNTIYLCNFENVFEFLNIKNLDNDIIIKSYYPFLQVKQIETYENYLDQKDKLIIESKKLLDKNLIQYIDNVNLFYEINNKSKISVNYENKGMENLFFKIQSKNNYILPIEIIFKVIHSTIYLPFIKLNLSKNMENLYRLYTDKISNTGKKLPFLNKTLIFKLMKTIGKNKTVSFYVNTESDIKFLCEFEYNGDINVFIENLNYSDIDKINVLVKQYLNPIIKNINKVFEKNGYNIRYFDGIEEDNINIKEIIYKLNIEISKNINLNKIIGCLSSIFSVEQAILKKDISMRFKRVNYFSEMDSTEAFIIENINKDIDNSLIIELLEDNFNLEREKAIQKLSDVLSSMEVVSNLYKKKQIKQTSNPGFLTKIVQQKFNNNIIIEISNINSLFYLKTLDYYINSIILLTQNIESIEIDKDEIEKLCVKNKINKEIVEVEDLKTNINDEELETGALYFEDEIDEKDDKYYNTLFGLDSDDEQDEIVGGADEIEIRSPVSDASSENNSSKRFGSSISIGTPVSDASSEKDISIRTPVSDASFEKDISIRSPVSDASSEKGITIGDALSDASYEKDISIRTPVSDASSEKGITIGDAVSDASSEKGITIGDALSDASSEKGITIGHAVSDASSKKGISIVDAVSDASSKKGISIGDAVSDASSKKGISIVDAVSDASSEKGITIGDALSDASSEKGITIGHAVSDASSKKGISIVDAVSDASSKKSISIVDALSDVPSQKSSDTLGKVITIKPKPKTESKREEQKKTEIPITIKPKPKKILKREIESSKLEKDITGMSISNPNPFSERLEERDPKLFLINEKDGNYKAYSRQCQWNARRQPVILTDKEKEKIDAEHPGSYQHAIKYGSDPNKQYWYICPRYWSLTKNTSLTEEEVKSGKYGNVIPQNAKVVPEDASIFEFTDNRVHKDKNDEYIQHYPGFILKNDAHPDKLCLPCCFKSWDTPSQKKRREQCQMNVEEQESVKDDNDLIDIKVDGENYIKGSEKFPLDPNRWGFLPIVIQKFLRTDNKLCQISISNANLKENHICILRQGVEIHNKHSFIACIASAYKPQIYNNKIYSIKFMKKKLIDILNIDIFITLQNGSLLDIFYNKNNEVDIKKYSSSKLYKNNEFFKRLVNSYENFIKYLSSDEYIDYTYLWDLICMPNKDLFENGLNLIILEMTYDDITDNVKLICPSNHYASTFFDKDKNSLILLKNGVYFEPIYTLLDTGNEYKIQRLFNLNNEKLLQNLKDSLLFISDSLNKNCNLKESKTDIYEFKQNKLLLDVVKIFNDNGIKIINQILNYNGLVIALIINFSDNELYIPVFPSSLLINDTIGFKYIDEVEWNSYEITKDLLQNISEITNETILSKPKLKVEEDGLIIGIITETNQFVGINPPVQDTFGDDLIKIKDSNYLIADEKTLLNSNESFERNIVISKIKLENKMFTAFSNTIRILLGNQENINNLESIKHIVENQNDYIEKLDNIVEILKNMTSDYIEFIDLNDSDLFSIKDIDICINNKDDCDNNQFCKYNKVCKLLLSKTNLINGSDNSVTYYGKLADQLIRYKRINNFILKQKGFIAFNKIDYILNDDEIIILQSMLNQEYFEGNIILNKNKFIENTSYYNVNPYKQKFDDIKLSFSNIKNKKKLILKSKQLNPEVKPEGDPKNSDVELDGDPKNSDVEPDGDQATQHVEDAKIIKQEKTIKPIKQEKRTKTTKQEKTIKPAKTTKIKKLILTNTDSCNKVTKTITTKWKPFFPHNTNEIEYTYTNTNCTFDIMIDIINDYGEEVDLNVIKNILIKEYENYGSYLFLIYNIFSNEGKSDISKKLLLGEIDLETLILSESYYLSNLDILVLANYYSLPLILLTSFKLKENNKSFLVMNKSESYFYFVKVPMVISSEKFIYRLFYNEDNIKLQKNKLSLSLQNDIRIEEEFDLEKYIKNYSITNKKPFKLKLVDNEEEIQRPLIRNKSL